MRTVNIIPSCAFLLPISTVFALMFKCGSLNINFPQGPGGAP